MRATHSYKQITAVFALLAFFLVGSRANNTSFGVHNMRALRVDSVAKKQTPPPPPPPSSPNSNPLISSGKKERIFIEHVDVLKFDQSINPDAQILVGNVQLRHNDANMYCDSALLYEAENRFEAYNNVRIEQGDSLFIYCNYLDYHGQLMLARLRELVRMEHGENTLYTDSLDYDRVLGIGYYFDYGSIVDSLNILSSVYGEYSTITKQAVFNDSVVLENPNFILRSDTLNYDTESKIATILGPTVIEGDSGVIHTTRGEYDTQSDRAYLMDKPIIESGTRWMTGDSIFYDRPAGLVEMYRNIELRDTADQVSLFGNYAEYHENNGYGLARDRAYISDYSSEDTLYVHASVLEMNKVDSVATLFKGLGNVRLYREDMQAVADTMTYNTGDSIMNCVGSPFIWSGKSQVTGDTVSIFMDSDEIDRAHIRENAFMIGQIDDKYFNQMRGREVMAYFSNSKLDSLWTNGNAEVIYVSLSPDSVPLELIKTRSSNVMMLFEKEEIEKIKMVSQPGGTVTPVFLLEPTDLTFPDFVWFPEGRPKNFSDIFKTTPKKGGGSANPNTEVNSTEAVLPKDENVATDSVKEEIVN